MSGIDASQLRDGNTYAKAALLVKSELQKINPKNDIKIADTTSLENKLLQAGDNKVELSLIFEGKNYLVDVLFKNVKAYLKFYELKKIYGLPIATTYYDTKSVIDNYQYRIDKKFPNQNIKISLKYRTDKFKSIKSGLNQFAVVYKQNGFTQNGMIMPVGVIDSLEYKNAIPLEFEDYVYEGIDEKQLSDHINVENNLYEAFNAVRNFLIKKHGNVWITFPDIEKEAKNKKLSLGKNRIPMLLHRKSEILRFSITLKNVRVKPPHFAILDKYKTPQDKKLWDIFELIGSYDFSNSMAGKLMGDIPAKLQKVIEQDHKISGIKIKSYFPSSVSSQKIIAGKNFSLQVLIEDMSTKRDIHVPLNLYVYPK